VPFGGKRPAATILARRRGRACTTSGFGSRCPRRRPKIAAPMATATYPTGVPTAPTARPLAASTDAIAIQIPSRRPINFRPMNRSALFNGSTLPWLFPAVGGVLFGSRGERATPSYGPCKRPLGTPTVGVEVVSVTALSRGVETWSRSMHSEAVPNEPDSPTRPAGPSLSTATTHLRPILPHRARSVP